ncbi:MAG: FAD-binding oxidoreductase [Kouleothrix sp.]|jgi:glycine/D-amino acid oxidase-like deaminating enzyme|nr:FAD-binding oxidoreductase [Kouleothrix sp.]
MSASSAEIVICGAGIAGIAAAYYLSASHGVGDIVLLEQAEPLALTSDKSTEAYRNWWPGPGDTMVRFMGRSIDLLEAIAHDTGNLIMLNRRGYAYATADPARVAEFRRAAAEASALGAGPLRVHGEPGAPASYVPAPAHGFAGQPDGADLLLDPALIREHFPYLAEHVVAVLHPRRCGWFSAQQLGMYMLEQARARGVRLLRGRVTGVDTAGGRVRAVQVQSAHGPQTIASPCFINAAGPMLGAVGQLLGLELPVFCERHIKIAFNDYLGVVPRAAPMLIWADEIRLPWDADERAALAEDADTAWMLDRLPAGVHCRPEGHTGASTLLILWNIHLDPVAPVFPVPVEQHYPELALRGMATMIPGLARYIERAPQPYIDGGYYTKTRENRPLIGPLPIAGAYVVGALSGYGLMAACAAGELIAAHISGAALPSYAAALAPARYDDPGYRQLLEHWGDSGQL